MPSVIHVELLKLLGDIDEQKMHNLMLAARSDVPGLIELHFGRRMASEFQADGNTHGMSTRFLTKDLLEAAKVHPRFTELMDFVYAFIERPPVSMDFVTNGRPHL